MNSNSVRIDLLGRENYDSWRMQMRAILIKDGVWGVVNGDVTKPSVNPEKWIELDQKAQADIVLSVMPSELRIIKHCESSKDMWSKLEETYQSKGPARKAALLKRLILNKMGEDDDTRDHIRQYFEIVDKLSEIDVVINEELLSVMLLYSLPASFENFRCAIESRDELPKLEQLRIKVIEESDARRKNISENTIDALVVKKRQNMNLSRNKKNFKCFRCDKFGNKRCLINGVII